MKSREAGSRLVEGALVLSLAAMLSKLIGTLQKIPLQNMGGDAVFGIYNTVYPLYTMIITIAAAGFPAALSKYVAEYEAAGLPGEGRRLFRYSSLVLLLFGMVLGTGVYFGAPVLGEWIGSSQVVPALQASAAALAFVPWLALSRGYFQGLHNMVPTAVSQVIEQMVRVSVMIVLLVYMTRAGAGAEEIAAGALAGSAAGGAAGLLVMFWCWSRHKRNRLKERGSLRPPADSQALDSRRVMLRRMVVYAVPVCLSALSVPLISLVDTFTVPRLLRDSGLDGQAAMAEFGVYNRGMPLVQLVTMLASSLSVLFIPALSEAKFKGEHALAARQSQAAMLWFWLLGMAASIGLAVLAEPINIMLYKNSLGTGVMQWVAFTAAGSTMSIISAALLQGMGMVKAPAVHLLAAAVLKLALNLLLVPRYGITGAAIAGTAAHLAAAALNAALLARAGGLSPGARGSARTALLLAAVALAAWAAAEAATGLAAAAGFGASRLSAVAASLAGVAAGAAAFLGGAARLKLLTEEELRLLPKVGRPLAGLLRRLRLLA